MCEVCNHASGAQGLDFPDFHLCEGDLWVVSGSCGGALGGPVCSPACPRLGELGGSVGGGWRLVACV